VRTSFFLPLGYENQTIADTFRRSHWSDACADVDIILQTGWAKRQKAGEHSF